MALVCCGCHLWISSLAQISKLNSDSLSQHDFIEGEKEALRIGSEIWATLSSHHVLGFSNCVGKCSAKWIGHLPCSDLDSELCRWVCEFAGGPSEVKKKKKTERETLQWFDNIHYIKIMLFIMWFHKQDHTKCSHKGFRSISPLLVSSHC